MNLMIWLALVTIVVSVRWSCSRRPIGLRIRAVGEHPRARRTRSASTSISIRYGAVTVSGMLAAAGGAYLSLGFVNSFSENMTAGRGFIALAALIFGNWRPVGAAAACLLFGFSSALAQRLQEYSTVASDALPGATVRAHPDRGRRSDRPLDPARSCWSPLQEAVAPRHPAGPGARRWRSSWVSCPC